MGRLLYALCVFPGRRRVDKKRHPPYVLPLYDMVSRLSRLTPDPSEVGPFHHGPRVRIIGYYMLNVAFTCVLWYVFQPIVMRATVDAQRVCSIGRSARLSILFSIIRLIPFLMKLRVYATMAAVLFGCMWAALIILKITVCETHPEWKQTQGVQCVLGPAVGGVELASTCPILLFCGG